MQKDVEPSLCIATWQKNFEIPKKKKGLCGLCFILDWTLFQGRKKGWFDHINAQRDATYSHGQGRQWVWLDECEHFISSGTSQEWDICWETHSVCQIEQVEEFIWTNMPSLMVVLEVWVIHEVSISSHQRGSLHEYEAV